MSEWLHSFIVFQTKEGARFEPPLYIPSPSFFIFKKVKKNNIDSVVSTTYAVLYLKEISIWHKHNRLFVDEQNEVMYLLRPNLQPDELVVIEQYSLKKGDYKNDYSRLK